MNYLNDEQLAKFCMGFLGYGNPMAKYWLIGMEEGGGNSFCEISARLEAWHDGGGQRFEDLYEYHKRIGQEYFFETTGRLQNTWGKLIRILLAAESMRPPDRNEIFTYQVSRLGRKNSNTCLLELLPLPSPSTNNWCYRNYSRLAYLNSRITYKDFLLKKRILEIKKQIEFYKPSVVLFYGFGYMKYWQDIAGVALVEVLDDVYMAISGCTKYVVAKHPAARGVTNEYFHSVGRFLSTNNMGQSSSLVTSA